MTANNAQRVMAELDWAKPASQGVRTGLRHAGWAVLLLMTLMLTGCISVLPADQQQVQKPPVTAAVPLPKAKPVPPELVKPPRPVAKAEPGVQTVNEVTAAASAHDLPIEQFVAEPHVEVALAHEPERRPVTLPPASPDTLVGLDQDQTISLLGMPASTEEAPPGKVWRYVNGDCALKVFFFLDMTSSQDFRALSYDMTSSANVPDFDTRCFAQLLAHAGGPRSDR